ncbi:Predicted membrane protein [Nocardia otitidiscaviarum]|uniref:Predicted membrane protein n=1 Tax=Nocardia otitidiscaviarum TaxID=1823 RepID=A0A379JJX9_9NOCA|nr:DoxX family protein [Nocardia otitidiscaviarum]SUD48293.1 Predicted membrane protein [Nocardia otitidiscaviarum]
MFGTLMLMVVPTLVFRLLGALGVRRFSTWRVSFAHGLAVLLMFTGAAHFAPDSIDVMPSHDDLTTMVPSALPFPGALVYVTGVLELLGALGLIVTRTRRVAGIGLAVLFVLMTPANIYVAVNDIPLNGDPATPLWFRLPEQIVYIAVALWAAGVAVPLIRARRAPAAPALSR